jgi:LPS O-antigen subunit length determinant protein (WzzB/FepE family)
MSKKANRSESVRNLTDYPEDEIELIDLFIVIWKWKYLIVAGTVFCALAAFAVNLILPKVYQVETIIRPGILSFGENGNNVYIDEPSNIKALIETGGFEKKILDQIDKSHTADTPKGLRFKVTLPNSSSTLKISYLTAHVDQGISALKLLGSYLMEEYVNLVDYFQNEIDRDINIKKAGIQQNDKLKRSHEANIKNIARRIKELETEIVFINENTSYLNKVRNELLSKGNDDNNILSIVLYTNTIQQNLQLANDYKSEIKNLKIGKETELQQISKLENELQKELAEIDNLKIKKRNIQSIQIIQEPYSSSDPVKPKKALNVILASCGGLFLMIFLAYLIEYISRHKK